MTFFGLQNFRFWTCRCNKPELLFGKAIEDCIWVLSTNCLMKMLLFYLFVLCQLLDVCNSLQQRSAASKQKLFVLAISPVIIFLNVLHHLTSIFCTLHTSTLIWLEFQLFHLYLFGEYQLLMYLLHWLSLNLLMTVLRTLSTLLPPYLHG